MDPITFMQLSGAVASGDTGTNSGSAQADGEDFTSVLAETVGIEPNETDSPSPDAETAPADAGPLTAAIAVLQDALSADDSGSADDSEPADVADGETAEQDVAPVETTAVEEAADDPATVKSTDAAPVAPAPAGPPAKGNAGAVSGSALPATAATAGSGGSLLDPSAGGEQQAGNAPGNGGEQADQDAEVEWNRLARDEFAGIEKSTTRLKPSAAEVERMVRAPALVTEDSAAPQMAMKTDTADGQASSGSTFDVESVGASKTDRGLVIENASRLRPGASAAAVVDQVAVQIQRAASGGTDRVVIQLQPEELGRVEVRLEIGDDAAVRTTVIADRPETLDLLQRDARALERSLGNAGLRTDGDSLNFSLRDQGADGKNGGSAGGDDHQQDGLSELEDVAPAALDRTGIANYVVDLAAGRLDISA